MSSRLLFGYLALALGSVVLAAVVLLAIRILTLDTPTPPAPKTKAPHYVVKRGDTLSEVVERTGVAMQQLERLNPVLDPQALSVGERIRLRASAPRRVAGRARNRRRGLGDAVTRAVKAVALPRRRYYVVKRGDGMTAIAEKIGVPVYRVIELNRGIRPDKLVPGQRIKVRR